MRGSQFQRFLALYSKKYDMLSKGIITKQTVKNKALFFIRADKFSLLELNTLYYEFKTFASNRDSDASWAELMKTLKKFTVPVININVINHNNHEHEFLVWVDRLASFVIPVYKNQPIEEVNFQSLEEVRRSLISFAIRTYHRLMKVDSKRLQAHLPRALTAAMLYGFSQDLYKQFSKANPKELSGPVTLELLSAEVMLSIPTITRARLAITELNQRTP